ncbi:MAG: MFS transporter [Methylococcaceae bacterium]|nr:MFS transporter [Methylococcaceae bacterium]
MLPQSNPIPTSTRKAVIAGILGNTIEWYDFALYGHFSLFIGQTFFPKEQPGLAMLAAFAVFSVSFFMRPLGAIIFSAIGDRHGRKKALSLSMLGMAIPTAGIGLLPAFADIGYTATALLVLLRLFQGLSLGGEMGGAVTYVMEHTPERRIGLASSLIQASTCVGLLFGTLISSGISALLTEDQFSEWGWRIPFLLGLLAAWIGWQIRRAMPESALYELAKSEDRLLRNPIRSLFAWQKRQIVLGVAVIAPMTCGFFFAFVYFNSLMIGELGFPASRALMITSIGLTLSLTATLLGGWLADRRGYKPVLVLGAGLLLLGVYPLVGLLSGKAGPDPVLPAFFAFSLILGIYTSAAFAAVAGLFATEVRYSGVSFAVNIASPVFGSTAPLLAAWLIRDSGLVSGFQVFGGYLIALSMMAAWAILQLDRQAFERWGEPRSSGVNA